MVSRFVRFLAPAAFAALAFAAVGCAGSKSPAASGSDYSAMDNGEASSSAKLEEARRSAEEAEGKAHQLREEKASKQSKPASN